MLVRGLTGRGRHRRGFTLIELLIALAIGGLLTAVAVPGYQAFIAKGKRQLAIADIVEIDGRVMRVKAERGTLPATLADVGWTKNDPWGNPYVYTIYTGKNNLDMRKDKNLKPINTDFDLYSMGPDEKTQRPLTAKVSVDDIVRAANGRFVGVAADF